LVNEFGLTEKAVSEGGVEVAIRGDGAEICGSTADQQMCMGIQIMDIDSIDPNTNEPMYYEVVTVGGRERIEYKNFHKSDGVAVAAIALRRELVKLIKEVFSDFFKFGQELRINGLMENGEEPAFFAISLCYMR